MRKCLFDFIHAGVLIIIKQSLGSHYHPRCAKSALDCPGKRKSFLNKVWVFRSAQSLHCDHLGIVKRYDFSETRTNGFIVHDHCTCAALPITIAALFHAGQTKVFSKYVQQRLVLIHDKRVFLSVDGQTNSLHIPLLFLCQTSRPFRRMKVCYPFITKPRTICPLQFGTWLPAAYVVPMVQALAVACPGFSGVVALFSSSPLPMGLYPSCLKLPHKDTNRDVRSSDKVLLSHS